MVEVPNVVQVPHVIDVHKAKKEKNQTKYMLSLKDMKLKIRKHPQFSCHFTHKTSGRKPSANIAHCQAADFMRLSGATKSLKKYPHAVFVFACGVNHRYARVTTSEFQSRLSTSQAPTTKGIQARTAASLQTLQPTRQTGSQEDQAVPSRRSKS
jgi:hypothetical protein